MKTGLHVLATRWNKLTCRFHARVPRVHTFSIAAGRRFGSGAVVQMDRGSLRFISLRGCWID